MPPDNLEELFEQGYAQTDEFLQSEKFKKFLTDLNVPPASTTDINGAIQEEKTHAWKKTTYKIISTMEKKSFYVFYFYWEKKDYLMFYLCDQWNISSRLHTQYY